jgi:type VI secretion system protein ImpF
MSPHVNIRLPLLDRLLNDDSDETDDGRTPNALAVETLRDAVLRDVDALLNARRRRRPLPANLTELPRSSVGFGVPDPAAGCFTDPERRSALKREIELALSLFEPRLTSIVISLPPATSETFDRTLRLRVEAVLRADPVQEQISFETVLRATTLDVLVHGQ